MIVREHRKFRKQYKKLSSKIQKKVQEKIGLFIENPLDIQLKNHALSGDMQGKRAISVTGDIRIIFEEFEDYTLVIMLDVGSHAQVYT